MQEIQLTRLIFPVRLHISFDAKSGQVIIQKCVLSWKTEFVRLTTQDALKFAEFLEASSLNSTAKPIITGLVGEINGTMARRTGTSRVRMRVSVKRSDSITIAVRLIMGLRAYFSRFRASAEEAQRFAKVLREANTKQL